MIEKAIIFLKEHGYDAFELSGVLMIPVSKDEARKLDVIASKLKKLLVECGYNKSWCVDPYYYERHSGLTAEMFDKA